MTIYLRIIIFYLYELNFFWPAELNSNTYTCVTRYAYILLNHIGNVFTMHAHPKSYKHRYVKVIRAAMSVEDAGVNIFIL